MPLNIVPDGTDYSQYVPFSNIPVPEIRGGEVLLIAQLIDYIILIVVEASATQFNNVEAIFYPEKSDDNLDYVGAILDSVFANVQDLIKQTAEGLVKAEKSSVFEVLQVIDRRLPQVEEEIQAMEVTLKAIQKKSLALAQEFIKGEVEAIQEYRLTAKKRSGVFPYVMIFPKFVAVMEKRLQGAQDDGKDKARAVLNEAYQVISSAIFAAFGQLTAEALQTEDEKENLNANVMTVQNAQYLLNELRSIKNPAAESITKQAKLEFDRNLAAYAALSTPRLLKNLPEFFGGIKKLLETEAAEEIAFHTLYNKSAARAAVSSVSPKDLRKSVELLLERVVKHFGTETSLASVVWHAVQEYILAEVASYIEVIGKVYPASDIQLTFSVNDLLTYFKEVS